MIGTGDDSLPSASVLVDAIIKGVNTGAASEPRHTEMVSCVQ